MKRKQIEPEMERDGGKRSMDRFALFTSNPNSVELLDSPGEPSEDNEGRDAGLGALWMCVPGKTWIFSQVGFTSVIIILVSRV